MSEPTARSGSPSTSPQARHPRPPGRAVERSLPHLGIAGVSGVRVGRRVELTVEAADEAAARASRRAARGELLSNPLIEQFAVEALGGRRRRRRGGG